MLESRDINPRMLSGSSLSEIFSFLVSFTVEVIEKSSVFHTFHYFLYWTCRFTSSQGVFQWSADCKVNLGGCCSNEVDGWLKTSQTSTWDLSTVQHKYLRTSSICRSLEQQEKEVKRRNLEQLELETTLPHTAGTLQIFKCPFGVSQVCRQVAKRLNK